MIIVSNSSCVTADLNKIVRNDRFTVWTSLSQNPPH